MELLDGRSLASEIRSEIKSEIKGCMIRPSLAVIQIGNDEASNIYINNIYCVMISFSFDFYFM